MKRPGMEGAGGADGAEAAGARTARNGVDDARAAGGALAGLPGVAGALAAPASAPGGAGLLPLGHGGAVALARMVALANPRSAPVQRLVQQAEAAGRLLDLTFGRRTRAVLLLDSGHVVLASLMAETVLARWAAADGGARGGRR